MEEYDGIYDLPVGLCSTSGRVNDIIERVLMHLDDT